MSEVEDFANRLSITIEQRFVANRHPYMTPQTIQQAIQAAHGSFVIEPALSKIQGADRLAAETIIRGSLAESIQSVLLIAAVLAISAAAAGTLLPRSTKITDPTGS